MGFLFPVCQTKNLSKDRSVDQLSPLEPFSFKMPSTAIQLVNILWTLHFIQQLWALQFHYFSAKLETNIKIL